MTDSASHNDPVELNHIPSVDEFMIYVDAVAYRQGQELAQRVLSQLATNLQTHMGLDAAEWVDPSNTRVGEAALLILQQAGYKATYVDEYLSVYWLGANHD